MLRPLFILLCALWPLAALAAGPEDIREAHRAAAASMFAGFEGGVRLTGTVEQNGSTGSFEAIFAADEWLVSQRFGELETVSYSSEAEDWAGSNYALPFLLTPEDQPASTVMNLLSSGRYLEEDYFQYFSYDGEEAGGYNCHFAPPGLPPVSLVLYSDPEEPEYLQVMSAEVQFAVNDPTCMRHRSFYYYNADEQGRLMTQRETGRELDHNGDEVSFSDYSVEQVERGGEFPAGLGFDSGRGPVGDGAGQPAAPVDIPAETSNGYFIVPLTFAGNPEPFYFILDTGASASLFDAAAADAAQLTSALSVPGHGHGSRAEFEIGMCNGAVMGTADGAQAPLAPFPATRIGEDNPDVLRALANYGANGILGVSPLHQYVVTFNQPEGKLTLIPPALFEPANLGRPNLELWLDVEELIYAKGVLADTVAGEVVIDTGMQQDLAVLGETVANHGLELKKITERNNTVIGGVKSFDYVNVPSFQLGPLRMENKLASVSDDARGNMTARGVLGYVGVPMFFGVRITIDLFSERMYIEDPHGTGLFDGLVPPAPPADDAATGEAPAPAGTPA